MAENLFPTVGVEAAEYDTSDTAANGDVTYGSTVQFDFDKHEFILSPTGKQKEVTEADAWGEWCVKALCTERFNYLIYDSSYGEELDTLLGTSRPHEVIESEIRRMVKECLMCDKRTASVSEFSFQWVEDGIIFSCSITNTLGDDMTLTRKVVR